MKYIKYFILIITTFILFTPTTLAASSKFEPIIEVETEIIDNQVFLIIGYEGEEIIALTQEIGYENKYLELASISTLAEYDITKGKEKDEGDFNTIKILIDSNKVYKEVKYAILTFNIKDSFKVGKNATIFLYNYDAVGPNKDKYRHKGLEISVRRSESNEASFLLENIDSSTKTKYWLKSHYIVFLIIIFIIIAGICLIFIIPSTRKKENRSKDLKKKIEKGNSSIKPIKLDQDVIDKLGKEEKEVDMSEAIIVSDMKPFGEAASRFEELNNKDGRYDVSADQLTFESSGIKDLDVETTEDGVEIFDVDGDNNSKDDDKIDTLGMFILILITSTLFIGSIKAFGIIEYDIKALKENIVNDLKYDKELDYNNDKKIDLLDLLETKNPETIEYDKPEYDVPNFEPLE